MSRLLEPFIDIEDDDMDEHDEDYIDPDNMGDITIVRDEDGFLVGFVGDPDLVPEHVRSNPGALVQGVSGYPFETPVWGHADTFMELEECGLLQLVDEPKQVTFGPYEVFIYEAQI